MKKIVILTIIIIVSLSLAFADLKTDLETRKKVAVAYFETLTSGDIEAANELITIPFNLDMKKVLKTKDDVFAFHKQMLGRKGKRAIPEYTVEYTRDALTLDPKVFPPYTAFRFEIRGTDKLYIYVSNTEVPKILGFTD